MEGKVIWFQQVDKGQLFTKFSALPPLNEQYLWTKYIFKSISYI